MNNFIRDDYPETQTKIYGYHSDSINGNYKNFDWSKYILRVNENDKSQVLGFELETSSLEPIKLEVIKRITDLVPCILQKDGSVPAYSCEIITQPMSINWLHEHENDFKTLCEYLNNKHFTSFANGDCGLHIHFNKPSGEDIEERVVSRLWLIHNTYRDFIAKINGRDIDTQYARNMSYFENTPNKNYLYSTKFLWNGAVKNRDTHALCVNLQHKHTIEIRSPRGTLNFKSLMAKIEFWTNTFIECCKDQRIDRITWGKLTKGKYISEYCKAKDIITCLVLKDMTQNIERFEAKVAEYNSTVVEELSKLLSSLYKKSNKYDKDNVRRAVNKVRSELANIEFYGTETQPRYSYLRELTLYNEYDFIKDEAQKTLDTLNGLILPTMENTPECAKEV